MNRLRSPANAALLAIAIASLPLAGCVQSFAPAVTDPSQAYAPALAATSGPIIASVPNLRDAGGYRTSDGHLVRKGVLFRADQLDRITDADLTRLAALQPALVIDLRTETERMREPDRLPPGVRSLVLDVAGDSSSSLGGDMQGAMAAIASGKGAELLEQANREFVSLPSARKAYAGLIRALLRTDDGAVVYHCTAGKDRTGWASAVILSLLGVPRETVMQDYLLSNERLAAKNAADLDRFRKAGSPFDPAHLETVMTVRREFLEAAFDEVQQRHGSFNAYARDGLGLTQQEIAALRAKYLTRSAASSALRSPRAISPYSPRP